MNNNFNEKMMNSAIKAGGGKIDPNALKQAVKTGDSSALLKNLSEEDRNKINKMLSDKTALANLLKSPQAAEIIKKLSGGGKNG